MCLAQFLVYSCLGNMASESRFVYQLPTPMSTSQVWMVCIHIHTQAHMHIGPNSSFTRVTPDKDFPLNIPSSWTCLCTVPTTPPTLAPTTLAGWAHLATFFAAELGGRRGFPPPAGPAESTAASHRGCSPPPGSPLPLQDKGSC